MSRPSRALQDLGVPAGGALGASVRANAEGGTRRSAPADEPGTRDAPRISASRRRPSRARRSAARRPCRRGGRTACCRRPEPRCGPSPSRRDLWGLRTAPWRRGRRFRHVVRAVDRDHDTRGPDDRHGDHSIRAESPRAAAHPRRPRGAEIHREERGARRGERARSVPRRARTGGSRRPGRDRVRRPRPSGPRRRALVGTRRGRAGRRRSRGGLGDREPRPRRPRPPRRGRGDRRPPPRTRRERTQRPRARHQRTTASLAREQGSFPPPGTPGSLDPRPKEEETFVPHPGP
jgi:hypothetical protein